jgi:hypothetical protein
MINFATATAAAAINQSELAQCGLECGHQAGNIFRSKQVVAFGVD